MSSFSDDDRINYKAACLQTLINKILVIEHFRLLVGCGRFVSEEKREEKKEPRISTLLHLLRTLLNTSKQNTWNTIDRENYQLQQMPQVYVSNRMPLRSRQES